MKRSTTIFLILLIVITATISLLFISNKVNILGFSFFSNIKENNTVILKSDEDFLMWYEDFINLYKKKKNSFYPDISINLDYFKEINKLLNNEETDVYFKDSKYYVNTNDTLELDAPSRSLRYVSADGIITEVRLANGYYYIQLLEGDILYKIYFNKDMIKYKKYKDINVIEKTIFGTVKLDW